MAQNRIGLGHLVSCVGALVALAALWLPWLTIDMSKLRQEPAFKAGLELGLGQQVTAEINRFLALLPGKIDGNGWDVLERTDIAFAIGAAAVIALAYATAMLKADSRATAQTMLAIGMLGMFLVLVKLVSPGIPDDASSFVSRGPGWIVALGGWAICAAGGIFAIRDPAESVIEHPISAATESLKPESPAPLIPEYTPDPDRVSDSIAPPPRA